MMMAMISPSGREVSPPGSSCRSSRLDLLKFRLVAAAKPRKSSLLIFPDQDASYSKRGGLVGLQAAHKLAHRHQGVVAEWGLVGPWWPPSRSSFAQYF